MEDNLKIILDEFERLKGQFVITEMNKVERFVAIGDDEEDWYYITYNGKDLHWQSCVGRIIPLKGYIREQDYNYLVHIAKMNHYDQVDLSANGNKDEFLKYVETYISKYTKRDKFITELCWDLN
jgi:hypothetical protein